MAISAQTPVPTHRGWVLASDLKPGDYIFKPEGGAQPILSVQTYLPSECYRVHLSDGLTIEGDRHAKMMLQDSVWRHHQQLWFNNQSSKYAKKKFRRPLKAKTFKELHKGPLTERGKRRLWSLQATNPVQYPTIDLPVPPYVFGLWFGTVTPDGRHHINGRDFNKMLRRCRQRGYFLSKKGNDFSFRPGIRESFVYAGIPAPEKIPQSYLESDVDSRTELLEGLLDSQKIKKSANRDRNYAAWGNFSEMRQIQQLLEGLGYITKLKKYDRWDSYYLTYNKKHDNPAKNRRYVHQVDKITPRQCVHVVADDEFVAGEGFISVC